MSATLFSRSSLFVYAGAVVLSAGLCLTGGDPRSTDGVATSSPATSPGSAAPGSAAPGSAAFVENRGQWNMPSPYVARMGAMTAFMEDRGWVFTLEKRITKARQLAGPLPVTDEPEWVRGRGVAVRMRFEGGTNKPALRPGPRTPGIYNYFLGSDPSKWRTDVAGHASLCYAGMYPGVDVQVRDGGGTLRYDLVLEPEADLSQVRVRVEGADSLSLDADGSLVMHTGLGLVSQKPPLTWEVSPSGEKRPLSCRYVMLGSDCFGFEVPRWSGDLALVVDPTLIYSTFLGGSANDEGVTVMQEPISGLIAVTGATLSTNFPASTGAYSTVNTGSNDVFVTTMTSSKTLVYSTYIGGTADDYGRSLFVRIGGQIWLAVTTYSTDMPTTPGAYDTTHNGSADWWAAQLPPSGNSLIYATYIGGPGSDGPRTIKVEANNNATLMGVAGAAGFPTTNGAYDTTYNGSTQDAAVARLNPTGTALVFATYIGGTGVDYALASDLGPNGEVIMTGYASAGDFPTTTGAYDNTWNSKFDAFVTSLHQSGSKLNYSTFLGTAGNDIGYALAVDSKGVVTVAGETDGLSPWPVTPGAFQSTLSAPRDVFVTRLDATGSNLVFSTLLGGSAFDGANGLSIASDGSTVVTGDTKSPDYPVTPDAHDTSHNGVEDVFVSHIDPTGKVLLYSTFLGDTGIDIGNKISFGLATDIATVTGKTASPSFPTTAGAYDTSHNNGDDAFIAQLQLHPSGIKRFGSSTPSCNGDVALYALADSTSPSAGFGLACLKSPPSTTGFLAITLNRLTTAVPIVGVSIWVDPNPAQLILLPIRTDSNGGFNLPVAIPSGVKKGLKAHVQVIWANTAACGGAGTNSASDALEITIQ